MIFPIKNKNNVKFYSVINLCCISITMWLHIITFDNTKAGK